MAMEDRRAKGTTRTVPDDAYLDEPYRDRTGRDLYPTDPGPRRAPERRAPGPGPTEEAALSVATLASALVFLAGIWLVMAPYVLNYSANGTGFDGYWNDVVIGATVAVVALVRMVTPGRSAALSIAHVGLGGWLVVAPWVLAYNAGIDAPAATRNDVIIGIVVTTLATVSLATGLFGSRGRRG
ncbi:MAG TPA: SPW repeat protein [Mycobacteriales bacterium]